MKTIYSPFTNSTNKYVDIIKRAMSIYGIQTYDMKKVLGNRSDNIEVANLNWFESKVNQKSLIKCVQGYVKSVVLVECMRLRRIKIVYTFHNKMAHDCKHRRLNHSFIKFMLNKADAIVVLCEESKNSIVQISSNKKILKKITVIPHPSYFNECGDYYKPLLVKRDFMQITFVGAIKKYKNIELLIEIAEKCSKLPVQFNICGRVESEEYKDELGKKVRACDNIKFNFGFLDDISLYKLITESDLLVLPYDLESSLNSGTLYLAFTLGRTAVCPKIGTVKEFPEELVYSYDYVNKEEHREKLYKSVMDAIEDYTCNFEEFKRKGDELHSIVNEKCSEEVIGRKYKALYDNLVKEH